MIVTKFGGTALADAQCIRRVGDIIRSDPQRRFVVVSAPGKRFPEDVKITDQLYRFQSTGDPTDFIPIEDRFDTIIRELGIELDLSDDYAEMKNEPHNADYMASCGEYLAARIIAAYLGWHFVDAEFCIFFDEYGHLDELRTSQTIRKTLQGLPCAVLPGYYGAMPDGQVRTFSRGGSDISGALVAAAMGADTYENWTDVSGVLAADPRIVPQAIAIPEITYAELSEMTSRGASVLHEDAVRPVWEQRIPIHICNTFRPADAGTWIHADSIPNGFPVTGVAGRKGFSVVQVDQNDFDDIDRHIHRTLVSLENRHIPAEYMTMGEYSFSLIVSSEMTDVCCRALREDGERISADSVLVKDRVATLAIIGNKIKDRPEMKEQLFSAFEEMGINVSMIDRDDSQMSIVICLAEEHFSTGMRAVYNKFF